MPIQRNKKGTPAGVITRKDALARDEAIAATGRQRNESMEKNRQSRRNGAAEQSAGGHSQQFDIIRGKAINFEFQKPRRRRTCPCEAILLKYSVVLSYSKQVIYLPPFPVGNGGYQG